MRYDIDMTGRPLGGGGRVCFLHLFLPSRFTIHRRSKETGDFRNLPFERDLGFHGGWSGLGRYFLFEGVVWGWGLSCQQLLGCAWYLVNEYNARL